MPLLDGNDCPLAILLNGNTRETVRRHPTIHLDAKAFPPGDKAALVAGDRDLDSILGEGEGKIHSEIAVPCVRESLAIDCVKRTAAIVAGVDAWGERILRHFPGALREGVDGKDGAGTDVDRKLIERGLHLSGERHLLDGGWGALGAGSAF